MCSAEELAASGGHSKPVKQPAVDGEQDRAIQKELGVPSTVSPLVFLPHLELTLTVFTKRYNL